MKLITALILLCAASAATANPFPQEMCRPDSNCSSNTTATVVMHP